MSDLNFSDFFSPFPAMPDEDHEPVKPAKKADPMDGLTKYIYVAPVAHRVRDLVRIMEGCVTGYEVTKCSKCHGRVDTGGQKDNFCRHCGARLENSNGRP